MNPTFLQTSKCRVWRLLKLAAVLAIAAGIVCQLKFAPVEVVAHTVRRGPIVAEVMGTGTLVARVEVKP